MAGVNKVILIGNLGADPEVRYSQNGTAVVKFRIATKETWKGKDDNKSERTEWHRITAFGRLGEICGQYLNKGKQVYIEGRLQTQKWEDRDGNTRYTTEIIAQNMQLLGSRSGGESEQARTEDEPPFFDPVDTGSDVPPF